MEEVQVKLIKVERVEGNVFDSFEFIFDADGQHAEARFLVSIKTKGDLAGAERQALAHVHDLAAAVKRATQES